MLKDHRRPEHLVTIRTAAERYEIGVRTIHRLIAEGGLTAYRVGRAIRIDPDELLALMAVPK